MSILVGTSMKSAYVALNTNNVKPNRLKTAFRSYDNYHHYCCFYSFSSICLDRHFFPCLPYRSLPDIPWIPLPPLPPLPHPPPPSFCSIFITRCQHRVSFLLLAVISLFSLPVCSISSLSLFIPGWWNKQRGRALMWLLVPRPNGPYVCVNACRFPA